MLWFRKTAFSLVSVTMLFAVGLTAGIINMCTNSSHLRSLDSDPFYNGTLGLYLVIVVIQIAMVSFGIWVYVLAYRMWANNYQLDHKMRHHIILWISLWSLFCLIQLAMAIYVIVRDKDPQSELAFLYQMFTKYNQESKMVGHFERYQRENSCCGIYGPDDWMMVTMKSGIGTGTAPGQNSFQSMDYGFRQNPSTGQCHLQPPTIPMGCGLKMLDEIHFTMYIIAAMMILEILIGVAAAAFVGYCFYYWLDKEVIVIPEDEVSNLLILEAESSTATTLGDGEGLGGRYMEGGYMEGGNMGGGFVGGGYLGTGSQGPYLGPPTDYPPPEYFPGSTSRGTSYVGSYHESADRRPTGYSDASASFDTYPYPPALPSTSVPGGIVPSIVPNGSTNPAEVLTPSSPMAGFPEPPTTSANFQPGIEERLSRAGPFDANSRYTPGASMHQGSYVYRAPTQQPVYQPYFYPRSPRLLYAGAQQPLYIGPHPTTYPATYPSNYDGHLQLGYNKIYQPTNNGYNAEPSGPPQNFNHSSSRRSNHSESQHLPPEANPSERHSNHPSTSNRRETRSQALHILAGVNDNHPSTSSRRNDRSQAHHTLPGVNDNHLKHHSNPQGHRQQHGNLKKLKSQEKSTGHQGSHKMSNVRRVEDPHHHHHDRHKSHKSPEQSKDFPNRSRSRRYNAELTEVLFKNPRPLDDIN